MSSSHGLSAARGGAAVTPLLRDQSAFLTTQLATDEDRDEILSFLSTRPIHTPIMTGRIRDNGVQSPSNRGTFYACRDKEGQLQGVGLIGHLTLFEVRNDAALAAFARLAQNFPRAHMIMGEEARIKVFWDHYKQAGQEPRMACRELLFERRWPIEVREDVCGLRIANQADLDLVVPVHAQIAYEESGVNPLDVDRVTFRARCARRIEQGRVWVLVKDGRLIFKVDVISDMPDVIYLEGAYVDPQERGKGYGLKCLSQVNRTLLARTKSLCLFVNAENRVSQRLYRRAGFQLRGRYHTIFLQPKPV